VKCSAPGGGGVQCGQRVRAAAQNPCVVPQNGSMRCAVVLQRYVAVVRGVLKHGRVAANKIRLYARTRQPTRNAVGKRQAPGNAASSVYAPAQAAVTTVRKVAGNRWQGTRKPKRWIIRYTSYMSKTHRLPQASRSR